MHDATACLGHMSLIPIGVVFVEVFGDDETQYSVSEVFQTFIAFADGVFGSGGVSHGEAEEGLAFEGDQLWDEAGHGLGRFWRTSAILATPRMISSSLVA